MDMLKIDTTLAQHGACAGHFDPDAWFTEPGHDEEAGRNHKRLGGKYEYDMQRTIMALAICSSCPVAQECLQAGMSEDYGIWGGLMAGERMSMNGSSMTGWRLGKLRVAQKVRHYARTKYAEVWKKYS